MFGLVLDCSALIPCCDKPSEEKEAIRQLGHILSNRNLKEHVIVYLSSRLIRVYQTKVAPQLKNHHPLPPFQASLLNLLPTFRKITAKSRKSLCKTIPSKVGIKFHILEHTRVQFYNVNDIGLTEEEDKEVLRVALVASTSHKTFLVTTDYHFLRNLNRTELSKRYPAESRKIKIVSPSDPNFNSFLIACLI